MGVLAVVMVCFLELTSQQWPECMRDNQVVLKNVPYGKVSVMSMNLQKQVPTQLGKKVSTIHIP